MNNQQIIEASARYLMPTYARFPLALVRGEGTRVWDADGHEYLDFLSGIAVCALGHCHPALVEAIREQAATLLHVSNLYHIEPQTRLARLLVEHTFADKVFFCNSGAEANEAAIKLARKWQKDQGQAQRIEIVTATQSFHGRTLATLTATGQDKIKTGFGPLPPGFRYVPYDDVGALADAVGPATVAVLLEPLQGEGGVRVPAAGYLQQVRDICDATDTLLILDEVQTGVGRTGAFLASEHDGVAPDICTLAKGLGGGVAIGACLATDAVAESFGPGTHASTFGGNPLATAAACAVVQTLLDEDVLGHCRAAGAHFRNRLNKLASATPEIAEVRGRGLLIGVELADGRPAAPLVGELLERGFLAGTAGDTVLRFAPPLTVELREIDILLVTLRELLGGAD